MMKPQQPIQASPLNHGLEFCIAGPDRSYLHNNPKLSDYAKQKRRNEPESLINLFMDPNGETYSYYSDTQELANKHQPPPPVHLHASIQSVHYSPTKYEKPRTSHNHMIAVKLADNSSGDNPHNARNHRHAHDIPQLTISEDRFNNNAVFRGCSPRNKSLPEFSPDLEGMASAFMLANAPGGTESWNYQESKESTQSFPVYYYADENFQQKQLQQYNSPIKNYSTRSHLAKERASRKSQFIHVQGIHNKALVESSAELRQKSCDQRMESNSSFDSSHSDSESSSESEEQVEAIDVLGDHLYSEKVFNPSAQWHRRDYHHIGINPPKNHNAIFPEKNQRRDKKETEERNLKILSANKLTKSSLAAVAQRLGVTDIESKIKSQSRQRNHQISSNNLSSSRTTGDKSASKAVSAGGKVRLNSAAKGQGINQINPLAQLKSHITKEMRHSQHTAHLDNDHRQLNSPEQRRSHHQRSGSVDSLSSDNSENNFSAAKHHKKTERKKGYTIVSDQPARVKPKQAPEHRSIEKQGSIAEAHDKFIQLLAKRGVLVGNNNDNDYIMSDKRLNAAVSGINGVINDLRYHDGEDSTANDSALAELAIKQLISHTEHGKISVRDLLRLREELRRREQQLQNSHSLVLDELRRKEFMLLQRKRYIEDYRAKYGRDPPSDAGKNWDENSQISAGYLDEQQRDVNLDPDRARQRVTGFSPYWYEKRTVDFVDDLRAYKGMLAGLDRLFYQLDR
jgi:hypothetical protein